MVSRIIFKGKVMDKVDLLLYINARSHLYLMQGLSLATLQERMHCTIKSNQMVGL